MQYVGLKIFYATRSPKLIDDLYHVGLSVSYDRVSELTKTFCEELRQSYFIHNCFFPRIRRKSIFSVWLKDNIDNPKANFNKSSYHGTSSSVIQCRATNDEGQEFPPIPSTGNISQDKKNWYLCLLNKLQSKIYTLHNLKMNFGHLLLLVMCHQQSFHLTIQQLLRSSNGSLFMQEISRQNYSIKMFILLYGLHIMHHRNVAYKLHQVSVLFFHY